MDGPSWVHRVTAKREPCTAGGRVGFGAVSQYLCRVLYTRQDAGRRWLRFSYNETLFMGQQKSTQKGSEELRSWASDAESRRNSENIGNGEWQQVRSHSSLAWKCETAAKHPALTAPLTPMRCMQLSWYELIRRTGSRADLYELKHIER